jgi:hypothetical protein
MSRRSRRTRRTAAVLAALMLAAPGVAAAKPAGDGLGPRAEKFINPPAQTVVNPPQEKFVNPPAEFAAEPSTPAPTVIRTVVKEEAVRALPIVLAGLALLIAIGSTGYALMRAAPRERLGGLH